MTLIERRVPNTYQNDSESCVNTVNRFNKNYIYTFDKKMLEMKCQ